jgi:hypothetical protein
MGNKSDAWYGIGAVAREDIFDYRLKQHVANVPLQEHNHTAWRITRQ